MGRPLKILGKRFGTWLVIKYVGNDKWHQALWLCVCDCGRTGVHRANALSSGDDKICTDCARVKRRNPDAALNTLFRTYIEDAKAKNLVFNLTKEDCKVLFKARCHYCGCEPNQVRVSQRGYSSYTYNGIDRKNNEVGYVTENCLPCCSFCNYKKRDTPYLEFTDWIKKVSENLRKEGLW